jgi:hypothetical protein
MLIGSAGTPANWGQDIVGTGFLTTYQYHALDDLLQVSQNRNRPAHSWSVNSSRFYLTVTQFRRGLL